MKPPIWHSKRQFLDGICLFVFCLAGFSYLLFLVQERGDRYMHTPLKSIATDGEKGERKKKLANDGAVNQLCSKYGLIYMIEREKDKYTLHILSFASLHLRCIMQPSRLLGSKDKEEEKQKKRGALH